MVYRVIFLLLLGFLLTTVHAQDNSLQVTVNPMSDNAMDYEVNFAWQATGGVQDGLAIQVPSAVKVVPQSVRVNDQEMWLKKSLERPAQDSVVCWEEGEDGLLFFFAESVIQSGTRLTIRCHGGVSGSVADTALAQVREASLQGETAQVTDAVLTQTNFPAITTQTEN